MSGLPRWRMRHRELFGMGQRMRWPSRRSMLRLAPPIMIGGDAARTLALVARCIWSHPRTIVGMLATVIAPDRAVMVSAL